MQVVFTVLTGVGNLDVVLGHLEREIEKEAAEAYLAFKSLLQCLESCDDSILEFHVLIPTLEP